MAVLASKNEISGCLDNVALNDFVPNAFCANFGLYANHIEYSKPRLDLCGQTSGDVFEAEKIYELFDSEQFVEVTLKGNVARFLALALRSLMFRLFARQDLRRPQLWILLWMLPYFVFSVWASPVHFHSPDGRDIPLSSLAEAISSTRSDSQNPQRVEKTSATIDAGECFLCDWNAHASQIITAAVFPRPSQRAQNVLVPTPQSPLFFLAHISRNRGPPLFS